MKNFGTMKLGSKNVFAHKFFSIFVILTLGIIFGISTAATLNKISEAKENISVESKETDGKVLYKINLCKSNYLEEGCDTPENYDSVALKAAKKYSGETIGAKISYINDKNEKVFVVLERAGKILNHGKTFFTSEGKIPVVKNSEEKIDENIYESYEDYKSDETPFYIMMDDTMTVMNYLFINNFRMESYEPLVIFDDENSAYDFYKNERSGNFEINQIFNKTILAKEKLDNAIKLAFTTLLALFGISIVILLIFVIVIFRKDKKNVSIYRTFGATKKDIFRIYLSSGIIIFVSSILISVIVYLITSLIIS